MGSSLYIVLERELPGWDAGSIDGKAISRAAEKLDEIARSLNVTPLMEFFSVDLEEDADMMEEYAIDPSTVNGPVDQWFDARHGLATVQALGDYLTRNPDAVPNTAQVEADLAACERLLAVAQEKGLGWHLRVDF